MNIKEAPIGTYKDLLTKLPKFPVGFRGQPAVFNEDTVTKGFEKPREYFVLDLKRLDMAEITEYWPEFTKRFNFSIRCGQTHGNVAQYKNQSVEDAIAYYGEHPTDYSSILVLTFPELIDWPFAQLKDKKVTYSWFRHKLPRRNIAGVIYPLEEDFLGFEAMRRKDASLGGSFGPMHQYMENTLMRRYLEFLVTHPLGSGAPEQDK